MSDWVEAHAADTLAARASRLAAIERAPEATRLASGPSVEGENADRLAVVLHTDVESTGAGSLARRSRARDAWRGRGGAVLIVGVVGAAGLVLLGDRRDRSAPAVARPLAVAVATVSATTPSGSALAAPAAPAPLASSADAPRHPDTARPSKPAVAPTPDRPPRDGCSPPYQTDAEGTRVYKLRCL